MFAKPPRGDRLSDAAFTPPLLGKEVRMLANLAQYELVLIDSLVADPQNPRYIKDHDLARLADSIDKFGFVVPVLVRRSDRLVIGGHQRIEAARRLGHQQVPVVWWEGSDKDARALNLALNRIGGDWNEERLSSVLAELAGVESLREALLGFDSTLTGLAGFDAREVLASLELHLADDGQKEDLAGLANELFRPERSSSIEQGDLFDLGPHRLICGDAADEATLQKLCSLRPRLVFTDPPYNVGYSAEAASDRPASSGRTNGRHKRKLGAIQGDDLSTTTYQAFMSQALSNAAEVTPPGSAFYVCGGTSTTTVYDAAFAAAGLVKSSILIWDKGSFSLGRKDYQSQYELLYYGWKKGERHAFFGGRHETDVWQIPRDPGATYIHPTQKPVVLAARALKNSSRAGEAVLDLFAGSGSTLIAAEQMGRRAFLVEIDPHFVEVIIRRWERYTGQRATKSAAD
jgi:DNA modification methylase